MGSVFRFAAAGAAVFAAVSAAEAGPSTQDGAERLTAAFQAYLTATPGVVTVSPTGDAYKVTLDAVPLAAKAGGDAAFSMSPVVLTLTDNGDGRWGVVQDQPFSFDARVPGIFEGSARVAALTMQGVWSEDLKSFASYGATMTDLDYVTTTFGPEGTAPVRQVQRIASMAITGTGVAAADGGLDATQTFDAQGLTQTMTLPATTPEGAAQDIAVSAAAYGGDTRIEGLRATEVLDLVAWFVAHPSQAQIVAAQEELRARLTSLMPVFGHMTGDIDITDASVGTPVGTFGMAKAGVTIEAKGAVADGLLREAFRFEGITLPPGLVPDWALPLVPQSATVDIAGAGFDAATVAARVIAAFDLTRTPAIDPALEAEIGDLLLPDGTFTLTLAPGGMTGAEYGLTWEGTMQVTPGAPIPTGTGRITAKGLDAVRAALISAPPDIGGPASMGIGAAMAVGKAEADGTMVWDIDATVPGQVKINGRAMPMGGP